ncbi:MAG: glycosyltransferase family 2 protein [Eggerthellaceae bacterium]|nr:glycosyltransferase family 2 protein [Eggerthellaceae bacterium]
MSHPLVSVIVPVHDVEGYLALCVESLLAQTLSSIELVFVNDCSTDGSRAMLERYAAGNSERIRIVDTPSNVRAGGARNLGMAVARGDYFGFVDGDDYVAPTMFQELYDKAKATGADASFVQYASVDEGVNALVESSPSFAPLLIWGDDLLKYDGIDLDDQGRCSLIAYPVGGVYCGLYTRELIERASVHYPEHMRYDDNYWISLVKAYMNRVCFVESVAYFFVQRPNSTSRTPTREAIMQRRDIENMLLNEVKARGLFKKYHDAWEYIYTYRYALNTARSLIALPDTPCNDIVLIRNELNQEFPNWEQNPYYCNQPLKRKLIDKCILEHPRVFKAAKAVHG